MKEKRELSVLVRPFTIKASLSDTSAFHKISFITISDRDKVRNTSSMTFADDADHGFDNLVFRLWISWNNETREFRSSDWQMIYDQPYSVEFRDAELMVKIFKRIARIESKWIVRPSTFGQYVALICNGLGIKRFARPRGSETEWHDTTDYQFLEIKYLADVLDGYVDHAKERKFPKLKEAAA